MREYGNAGMRKNEKYKVKEKRNFSAKKPYSFF
jgi:hypothetical protein